MIDWGEPRSFGSFLLGKKTMLETGDLIFVSENTEMGQAIQASTGNYSHVAIFWTHLSCHSRKVAFLPSPEDFFEAESIWPFIAMRRWFVRRSKKKQGDEEALQCFLLSGWRWLLLFQFIAELLLTFWETISWVWGRRTRDWVRFLGRLLRELV